jgi:hypothetical protein
VDPGPDPQLPVTEWRSLTDTTWSAWYRFLPFSGRDADARGVFTVEDDQTLHILGIEPPAGDQDFGYVATRDEFSNYRLRVTQRWGTRKFAPRTDAVRDSGLLYHMRGDDMVWPQSVEFQIQEHDVGDLFLLGDIGATTPLGASKPGMLFGEGGAPLMLRGGAVTKGGTFDSLDDWNQLELIANEREFMHIVNGQVNHRGWDLEFQKNGQWQPLYGGRILLQAEGAEVFYRDVQVRPIVLATRRRTAWCCSTAPISPHSVSVTAATLAGRSKTARSKLRPAAATSSHASVSRTCACTSSSGCR